MAALGPHSSIYGFLCRGKRCESVYATCTLVQVGMFDVIHFADEDTDRNAPRI